MSVTVLGMKASDYMVGRHPEYEDTNQLFELYEKMAFHTSLILRGEKGIGKTLSVVAYCKQKGYPLVTVDCTEDLRRHHLLGSLMLNGDETPFVMGPLTNAIEVANEVGSCVVVFEELNALAPAVQKVLNPLTDFRRSIIVSEIGRVFRLREGSRLWVVGTMNYSSYGGTYELNEDLESRFATIRLGYPDHESEVRTLHRALGEAVDDNLLNALVGLAHMTRQSEVNYSLSTRDLVSLYHVYVRAGVKWMRRLVVDRYDEDQCGAVGNWFDSSYLGTL